MRIQAALGSDIALTFDECTPAHADGDYTARSTERTQRWLDRCLDWHEREGPADQAVFGIVQGGVHEDLRRESAEWTAAAGIDGIAIGGTLGRDKEEMHGVLGFTMPLLPDEAPRHLLGIGEVDDLLVGIGMGIDLFDCAIHPAGPPRDGARARPGGPLPHRPDKGGLRGRRLAGRRGMPLRGLRPPHPRLPALPGAQQGPDRHPPAHPPQPDLHA